MQSDYQQIGIPSLVRIKLGALDRIGVYTRRLNVQRPAVLFSAGLVGAIDGRAQESLHREGCAPPIRVDVQTGDFDEAVSIFRSLPASVDAVLGVGGGRALDVAKYVALLAGVRYLAVPTSLSNDGFCSPQVSLVLQGKRRSIQARMPVAVVVDTEVCRHAPISLWCAGVGDLVAKVTAVRDWKLAFHRAGTPVNDFAALLSDSSVLPFMAHPRRDVEGVRHLATALMLNGIAMSIAGSSRPASGSEHLISHALDEITHRPRSHGLQVGLASYLVTHLQGGDVTRLNEVFTHADFWRTVHQDPFDAQEWRRAIELAPNLKPSFHTVLNEPGVDALSVFSNLMQKDDDFSRCFSG